MKIIFGFNDIRQDGMGSEAISLMRAIKRQGIEVQPVHAWNKILVPGYVDEFNPIFIHHTEDEPKIDEVIERMVKVINEDHECNFFSHFGSPNWACVIPYLRSDIQIIVSAHSITPSALKISIVYKNRVSAFIAISWGVQNKLIKCLDRKNRNKVSLITNAIDTEFFKPIANLKKNNIIKIIFFGRIEDFTKGCDKIPKIAKILKERGVKFQWDIYGYFHWGYEKRFYKQIEEYDIEDVITYKGCVNQNEIPQILNQYDIMVMPSNHEGFGLALAEAMSMELCCVASYIPNVTNKILKHGEEGFLVKRNDIKGFANSIEKAANSNELRKKIGKAARQKIENKFSLRNQGKLYSELLNKLINQPKNYQEIKPEYPIHNYKMPESVKSHFLARILPLWFKRILKKYV